MNTTERIAPWIQTLNGRAFDFENMSRNKWDWKETATILSRLPRFTAHSRWRYSVAQHSVLVSRRFDTRSLRLVGLIHDVPEAFINDISSPVKHWLRDFGGTDALNVLEDRIWEWVAKQHLIDPWMIEKIKQEDLAALATEARDLMLPPPRPWIELPDPWPDRIDVWSEEYARDEWIRAYHEI